MVTTTIYYVQMARKKNEKMQMKKRINRILNYQLIHIHQYNVSLHFTEVIYRKGPKIDPRGTSEGTDHIISLLEKRSDCRNRWHLNQYSGISLMPSGN